MTDFVKLMIERLTAIDPRYGSQEHQRKFIERCEELQLREPCVKDHSQEQPPEHCYSGKGSCYSTKTIDAVAAWQMRK